jgi:hypothetical protein
MIPNHVLKKVTDIWTRIMLKIMSDGGAGDFHRRTTKRSIVMRSRLMGLAWTAALAAAAVLGTDTDASAYRWHRHHAPVVGMAAGSLIAAGIAQKERWSPPGYEGEYFYDGYAGSVYDPWYYGAAKPHYFAISPTAYINAPYAYCLRRFGMRRYCR